MGTIPVDTKQPTRKITDQLCGRLIVWDAGAPRENRVMLATEYTHTKNDLSTPGALKLSLHAAGASSEKASKNVSAINKVLKLYNLRYGSTEEPEYLCGRLIVWDVGCFQEKFVKLETDYQLPKYELSPEVELKPYVYDRKACKSARKAPSSLKPIAERFYSRHGYSQKDHSDDIS